MPKFSIIVPIYNVENYLSKCLDSLVNQTYKDIEIICINDGSTDDGLLRLQDYAQKDSRIKIINQENQGVSIARNKGLELAQGKYILFVDSDDWIDLKTCEVISEHISNEPEMLLFNTFHVTSNTKIECFIKEPYTAPMWACCYKTSIIKENGIQFPKEIKMAEDHIFKFNFLEYAKKIEKIDEYLYFYNATRDDSATKNWKTNILKNLEAYNYLINTDSYKKSTPKNQLKITDSFALLIYGAWIALPDKTLQKEYNRQTKSFLNYYKKFKNKDYKNLTGYNRIKYKHIWKILRKIKYFFIKIFKGGTMCNKLAKVIKKIIRFIFKIIGIKYIYLFIRENFRTCFDSDKYIAQCNVVTEIHKETFGKYKGINSGKDIVLIATGPSLNQYKPIENAINIGVNKAILYDNIKLNYFFSQDYDTKKYLNNIAKHDNLVSFLGQLQQFAYGDKNWNLSPYIIPESFIQKHHANKYFVYVKKPYLPMFLNPDINLTWLGDGGSVIFSAMQFALFTNPKKIYLVGCDCSNGYFDNNVEKIIPNELFVNGWREIKKFRDTYYPETEIISVNPVGLKGLFEDLVQE